MTPRLISRHVARWLGALLALAAMQVALAQEPVVEPAGRVARLSYIEGAVSLAEPSETGSEEWIEPALNRPLVSGDRLRIEGDGRAELQLDTAVIHLDRNSEFGFMRLDDDLVQMNLGDGAASVHVQRLAERETIQIETPNASVFLRHPGEYLVQVDPATQTTVVKARSGEASVVGVSGSRASHVVRANEQGVFSGTNELTARIDPLPPRTAFEAWANDRERRVAQSQSARYVSDDVIGYEDLDDNGEWIYEAGYGHVWRPLYVAPGWAPYRYGYGHWARVSPWGWTWVDNARWGFAPFHYGSWVHLNRGWCWVPGPRHVRSIDRPVYVNPADRDHLLGGHTRLPPLRGTASFFGDNPKRGGDFVTSRRRAPAADLERVERAVREHSRISPSRERLEIMRATQPRTRSLSPRAQIRSPVQSMRAAPARTHTARPASQARSQPSLQPRSHAATRSNAARPHTSARGVQLRTQKK